MLRIGVAQIDNYFDYEMNLRAILRAMEIQAENQADLVVFPECAVTGYNTGMKEIRESALLASVRSIQEAAKKHKMAVALPTPWPRGDGKFLNSVLLVDENGEIKTRFDKMGFQLGEDRLFVQGDPHARVFEIKGTTIGVIICIETTHDPWSYLPKDSGVEAIIWPGFYAVTAPRTWSDTQTPDSRKIRENVDHWKVPLLQVTCASSPEAQYWPEQEFGGSVILDARGKEAFSLATGKEECGIVEIEQGQILAARSIRRSFATIGLLSLLALASFSGCASVPPPQNVGEVTSVKDGLYYYQIVIHGEQLENVESVSLRFGDVSVPVQVMDKTQDKITGRILRKQFGTGKNVILELQTQEGKTLSKDVSNLWPHEKAAQGEGDYQWF